MGLRDIEIQNGIFTPENEFQKPLSLVKKAQLFGVKKSTFHDYLDVDKPNLITPERLLKAYENADNSDEYRKFKPKIKAVLQEVIEIELQELEFLQTRANALAFINTSTVFINIAFDDGTNTCQHIDINEMVTQLLRENTAVKKLDITVSTMQLEKTIAIIEAWAYSENGNFRNRLNVNVYVDDDQLPVTLIAGELKDRFTVLIADTEGFLDMTDALGEMLQQYSLQMRQYLAWSLPKSPEIRALKRMHYDYGATLFSTTEEKLSDAVFASLLQLATEAYEDNPIVEEGNVFVRLSKFLVPQLDETIANTLEIAFEMLHLKNP
jgi:hypothetical protein